MADGLMWCGEIGRGLFGLRTMKTVRPLHGVFCTTTGTRIRSDELMYTLPVTVTARILFKANVTVRYKMSFSTSICTLCLGCDRGFGRRMFIALFCRMISLYFNAAQLLLVTIGIGNRNL